MTARYIVRPFRTVVDGKSVRAYEVYDTVARDWVAQYTYRPAAKDEARERNKEQVALDLAQGAANG